MARIDLSGRRYGKLIVQKLSHNDSEDNNVWECVCDCGNTCYVRGKHLRQGRVLSCGCPVSEADLAKYDPRAIRVDVGQKVRFDPFMYGQGALADLVLGNRTTGTIVYVNELHRWFSVEYGKDGNKQRTSFNFADIGKTVKICT